MAIVKLPKKAVTRFDLPPVCVVTGKTEGVDYHKTTFQFIPMWARMSVVLCGLLGVILMFATMKRAEVEVPMTADANQGWKRAKLITALLIIGALVVMFVP